MPREVNPNRKKAYEIWVENNGNISNRRIAELLNEDEKKIAVWKQRDRWSVVQQNNNVVQQSGKIVVQQSGKNVVQQSKRKRGAPVGNKNSVGHGAPKGNKNSVGHSGGGPARNKKAVTTGEHETIWFDCITDEERHLYSRINKDAKSQVDEEIGLLTLRERRMMMRIQKILEGLDEKERKVLQELHTVKKPVEIIDPFTNTKHWEIMPMPEMVVTSIEEKQMRKIDDILRIEEALTRVQDKKVKLLALKREISGGEKPIVEDDGFIDALKAAAGSVWDGETAE